MDKNTIRRLVVYAYLILATILLLLMNSLFVFCLINVCLWILLIVLLKLDIKHPLVIFLLIFLLYQISYPVLNALGVKVFEYEQLNEQYYTLNWLATAAFIIFYGDFRTIEYQKAKISLRSGDKLLKILYVIFLVIAISSSFYLIRAGFQRKIDVTRGGGLLGSVGTISYVGILPITFFLLISQRTSRKNKIFIALLTAAATSFGMLTFGERSFLFNYLIMLIIYLSTVGMLNTARTIFIGVACVILLAVSPSLKMFFSSSYYSSSKSDDHGIIVNFLNSDFAAAGFNFNFLLNHENLYSKKKGSSYAFDFLSPVADFVPAIAEHNVTKWYTRTFWGSRKTGLGFSILAEGYVNFGIAGILLEMFLLARLIKFVYLRSSRSPYWYIIYLGMLSLVMYACRESLGHIISPLTKYYILISIALLVINSRHRLMASTTERKTEAA